MSKVMDSGQKRLEELGYKQVLKRNLSALSNLSISLSIITIIIGVSTLYGSGLRYGGFISMVYGWLITGFFIACVALSMAEICSAYPTSGGLYFWSSRLAGPSWGPFAGWITGWWVLSTLGLYVGGMCFSVYIKYNVVGQWAITSSASFALATILQAMILLSTGGANGGGYLASKYMVILFHGLILLSQGIVNSMSITVLSFVGIFASIWNLVGSLVLIVLIPTVATERQSFRSVFTSFNSEPDVGIHSKPYIFLLGLLIGPWAILGYDASAHMTEETKASDRNGSKGILGSVAVSLVFGWFFLLAVCFATPDPQYAIDLGNDAGGYAIAQVFYSVFYNRYGNGVGGILCTGVVAVALWFSGISCVTSNSRMLFAFSRDGAVPLSKIWRYVDRRDVPINAVWLSICIAFIMALTSLGSVVAYNAMISIATLGLYIAYVLPTLFRITIARNTFVPGPFTMGRRLSLVVGWAAVIFVATITVIFCLPLAYPVTSETLNYTPVAVGGLFVIVIVWWVLSARKWFKGPIQTLEKNDLHPI